MPKPTIVITGAPDWASLVHDQLDAAYTVRHYADHAGYVARLVDDHTALILVDGAARDWRFWTTTPKASPATRRIPVLLVADDAAAQAEALIAGADMVLKPADLPARIYPLALEYASVPDAALLVELDCQCAEPLPPLAVAGVSKFNAGEYYRQHDLLEELWMNTPGPVRDLYRAILQVGVAYYQIERGNHRGALKMLLRSAQWLALLPDVCQGVDVKQLREDSRRVRAELERLSPADAAALDRSLLKPVRLVTPT